MRQWNKFLSMGLLIFGITLFLKNVIGIPEFFVGFGIGLGLFFELLGAYALRHDVSHLRMFKVKFIRKCFGY